MSEFEKELLNKVSPHDRTHNGHELFLGGFLAEHFKDWQPPKPQQSLPVVPEDVDKAIKYLKTQNNFATLSDLKKLDILTEKGFLWLNDFQFKDRRFGFGGLNNKLFILSHLAITGYTVEKEKKYILKHIDLSEQDNEVSLYLSHSLYKELQHERYSKDVDMSKIKQCHFTQSEIDKLNIGSYEQIEVEP